MTLRLIGTIAIAGAVLLAACNARLGTDPPSSRDAPDAGIADATAIDSAPPPDADDASDSTDTGHATDACADLASNPHHCGACGHDCLGGGCVEGKCQPVTLSEALLPASVQADTDPNGWLHFASYADPTSGGIFRLSKDGRVGPSRIWFDLSLPESAHTYDLARAGGDVCWTVGCGDCGNAFNGGRVYCASSDGSASRVVGANPTSDPGGFSTPWSLRLDPTSAFFVTRWNGSAIWAAPRDGSSPAQRLVMRPDLPASTWDPSLGITAIAADARPGATGRVYWPGGKYLYSARKDGSDARVEYTTVTVDEAVVGTGFVLVDDDYVFWWATNAWTYHGGGPVSLLRQPLAGCPDAGRCAELVLTSETGTTAGLLDDGDALLVADSNIVRVTKNGSDRTVLAKDQGRVTGITADATAFYWTIRDDASPAKGRVVKLAR